MDPWQLLAYVVAAAVVYLSYRKMKRMQKNTCQNDCHHCQMDCPSRSLPDGTDTSDKDGNKEKEEP